MELTRITVPFIFLNWRAIALFLLAMIAGSFELRADQTTSSFIDSHSPGINLAYFKKGAFVEEPSIVDCKTSAGTKTSCYLFKTVGAAAGREPGPFCPRTINDSAEQGGVWFDKNGAGDLVAISGLFIANLPTYYNDSNWNLYDKKTGKVRFTATKAACLGAAKPNVEEQYKQNCIECQLSYLDDNFSRNFLIPVQPIPAKSTQRVRSVGLALDGAELSGPAPVDAILGSYTIAAFDACGGHINVHQGYHYHASTGCAQYADSKGQYAPLIGYAADGYAIYAMKDAQGKEANDLDQCRGRSDEVRGYHYRVASPSENMLIGCLHGEVVMPARKKRKRPPASIRARMHD